MYLLYLVLRSWRTNAVDKAIAPHRYAILIAVLAIYKQPM